MPMFLVSMTTTSFFIHDSTLKFQMIDVNQLVLFLMQCIHIKNCKILSLLLEDQRNKNSFYK